MLLEHRDLLPHVRDVVLELLGPWVVLEVGQDGEVDLVRSLHLGP